MDCVWVITDSDGNVKAACDNEVRAETIAEQMNADDDGHYGGYWVRQVPYLTSNPQRVVIYQIREQIRDDGHIFQHRESETEMWSFQVERGGDLQPAHWVWYRDMPERGRLIVSGTDKTRVEELFAGLKHEILAGGSLRREQKAEGS